MLILNIETSTDVGAVSLCRDGFTWITREEKETGDHAGQLTLFIEDVMKMASLTVSDLDAVAVSAGPGSYTGLRIGISVAKGICYTLNKPLLAVDTLQAMAYGVQLFDEPGEKDIIVSLQDARRMDAYAAVYSNHLEMLKAPFFLTLESDSFLDLIPEGGHLYVCGNAADKWRGLVDDDRLIFSSVKSPTGRFMEKLSAERFLEGKFEETAYYEPFYLKPPNVTKPKGLL
jgi:tRNA threonylcarbamoyladenosine biosynthesis protein TsaB